MITAFPKKGVSYGRRGLSSAGSDTSESSLQRGKKVRPATAAATKVKSPSSHGLRPKTSNGNKRATSGLSSTPKAYSKYIDSSSLPKVETFIDDDGRQSSVDVKTWVKAQADLSTGHAGKNEQVDKVTQRVPDRSKSRLNGDISRPKSSRVVKPWSLTEVKQKSKTEKSQAASKREVTYLESDYDTSDDEADTISEVYTEIAEIERESTIAQQERLLNQDEDVKKESKPAVDKLEEWLHGEITDSDEYDTDLEDDFPPEPEEPPDASGANLYSKICNRHGIVPVSFLIRNLGESNLRMRHHYLGGDGTKPLAAAFKKNTITEEIDLADNYMESGGAAALAKMLHDNMFIITLNISNNFIGSDGAAAFAEMLEVNTTLKTLSLQGNQLTDVDAKRMSEALKNNQSLGCLDLSHNKFGEQGGVHLAAGIAGNVGLNDLDISWNAIRQKGAVAIAKALQTNDMIEILDMSWNGLGFTGTVALAKTLRVNKKLKVLDISHNRLTTEAAKKFAQGLAKNKGLETLLLGMNHIGDAGVEAILKATEKHPSLRLLGIEDIPISAQLCEKVRQLEKNKDIMIMYTSGSPQQAKVQQSVLLLFDRFITENAGRLEDLFNQLDKDGSGDVTLEELKFGLKDQGLRLTSKQLDNLLDIIDTDKSGTIEFSELTSGLAVASKEKAKRDQAQRDAEIYATVQPNVYSRPSSTVGSLQKS